MLKRILFCAGLATTLTLCNTAYSEKCPLKLLEEYDYTDIDCQFYLGTTAYRAEVYQVAVAHWQNILDLPIEYEGDEELKIDAKSNLSFLMFYGIGTDKNQSLAISNWKALVKKGHLESRRHLGTAFSNESFQYSNIVEALGWHLSVIMLFKNIDKPTESQQQTYKDASDGINQLKPQLSDDEIAEATRFAQSTLP